MTSLRDTVVVVLIVIAMLFTLPILVLPAMMVGLWRFGVVLFDLITGD